LVETMQLLIKLVIAMTGYSNSTDDNDNGLGITNNNTNTNTIY